MKKNLASGIALFILLATGLSGMEVKAQTLVIDSRMQYEYALSLFEQKDFSTSLVEFKRFIHFFPSDSRIRKAQFNVGQCHFFLEQYEKAARTFNTIILESKDEYLVEESVFLQSRAFVKLGNIAYAQIALRNYLQLTESPETKDRIYHQLAEIQVQLAKKGNRASVASAIRLIDSISEQGKQRYHTRERRAVLESAAAAPVKNPTLSGVLSVVPGGGFAYCERYKDGIVTFLLNVGLMAAVWQAWENDNEALAGVVAFVESGFYSANIYGAVSSAHKYNRAQVKQVLDSKYRILPVFNPAKEEVSLMLNFKF